MLKDYKHLPEETGTSEDEGEGDKSTDIRMHLISQHSSFRKDKKSFLFGVRRFFGNSFLFIFNDWKCVCVCV